MSPEEAADKSKALNEAISKNDIGRMRELAGDDKAVAMATPQEKAAMAKSLAEQAAASGDDRDGNREAINNLLKSGGTPESFRQILELAGPETIRAGLQAGVTDPAADKHLADFNITAGAMGAAEYATDPEQAAMGAGALEQGYSPQEVLAARHKVTHRGDDDNIKSLSKTRWP
jgi:triphosphoribosyl-dephospho-CoA synthetase